MDYTRITVLMNKRRMSGNELGRLLGKSGTGIRKMLANETCTVKDLERLCEIFEVPLSYFFDNSEILIVAEDKPRYQNQADRIRLLEKLVESKDETIALQKKEIDRLMEAREKKVG